MTAVWTVLIAVGVVVVLCAVVAVSALRIAKSINEDETPFTEADRFKPIVLGPKRRAALNRLWEDEQ